MIQPGGQNMNLCDEFLCSGTLRKHLKNGKTPLTHHKAFKVSTSEPESTIIISHFSLCRLKVFKEVRRSEHLSLSLSGPPGQCFGHCLHCCSWARSQLGDESRHRRAPLLLSERTATWRMHHGTLNGVSTRILNPGQLSDWVRLSPHRSCVIPSVINVPASAEGPEDECG